MVVIVFTKNVAAQITATAKLPALAIKECVNIWVAFAEALAYEQARSISRIPILTPFDALQHV